MSRPVPRPLLSEGGAVPLPPRVTSPLHRHLTEGLLAAMMLGYALLFGWLSLQRYWAFEMHALDMGNMGQAAWNTMHGHPFYFTNMRLPYNIEAWRTTTRLSFHVEFLFPFISLVYLAYGHPESLLILQTVAITLGALPVYLLARDVLHNAWLGLLFGAAYLLFPTLQALNLYEFHPVALAPPLLLYAFYFLHRDRTIPFVLCCVAAMGTKEQIGLVVALFGLCAALVYGRSRAGTALALGGVVWSLMAALLIEHHFRQPGTVTYLHTRYGYLGHGIRGVLTTLSHDPGVFWRVVMIGPKFGYVERLLGPTGYVGLLSPGFLILGAPTFLLNVLSTDFHMYSGVGDNSAELVAVTVIAAIFGTRLLIRVLRLWLRPTTAVAIAGLYLLAQILWSQHRNGFSPLGPAFQAPTISAHQRIEQRFVSMIPEGVPVSTQDTLDPHLSSRHYLYLMEDSGRQPPLVPANYVLLDASGPTYPLPSYQIHDRAMSLLRHGWHVATAQDGLILLRHGPGNTHIPESFYSFALSNSRSISHPLRGEYGALRLLGYDEADTDLPNHTVPNVAFTFFLEPSARSLRNLQPVVYETVRSHLVGCAHSPLGLAWFPTPRWSAGHVYAVRMEPIETHWNSEGTARFSVELRPVPGEPQPDCSMLWRTHSRLWPAGTLNIRF